MKYLSVTQTAEKWNMSVSRVRLLCQQGRIAGTEKMGKYYLVPDNAVKPKDARIKSGKYIKS